MRQNRNCKCINKNRQWELERDLLVLAQRGISIPPFGWHDCGNCFSDLTFVKIKLIERPY